ncbi:MULTISPECIES: tetratricopeptide repeat protein [Cyanophyceae]|uniref:Tetratricopeptide repeat protein n=1 Tax=Leptolyngbya subtilissima DQ-A4 TaxID=2933933 RepID=A0ABV0KAU0_9CYAN|nr:tetratricopeptide repeat protein [Nodosilinea sp. FACHB-141]MBD2115165.1 tetratricopeptide repeat protein [Nodosilinea sp. FACHB-141]
MLNPWPQRSQGRWLHALVLAGLCTTLLGSTSGASRAQPVPIAQVTERTPQTITGELSPTSPVVEDDGSYYEVHPFEGTAGEALTIDLISDDFNAYLILVSPTGERIAEDDDGAGGTLARITLTIPTTGAYTLLVNSYGSRETGSYRLETRAASATEQALEPANQLNQRVTELYQAGRYGEAIPRAEEALAINEQALGPDHPDTATSLNNLAMLYRSQGRYGEAEPLLQRALAINEQALGPDHPSTATSLNNLAELYWSQGRYGEAEPLYQHALEIREQAFGPDHPSTADSLNNLAFLYKSQGRYGEAEPLYQRALAITEQALSPDHPNTATSLNNLAELYRSQGRYGEAEPLYQHALEIREQALGPDHPSTARSLNNLAVLYRLQGRYGEAEPLYQRALAINEQVLGSNHPDTATSLNNLADLYRLQGRYGEAEPLYQHALTITEQALGPDHPDTAISLNNLAVLYRLQGRYGEAEPLYQRALAINEQVLGSNHPDTATSLNNLAVLSYAQGQLQPTLTYLSRGLAMEETVLSRNLVGGSDAHKRQYLATMAGTTDAAISLHLNDLPTDATAAQLALTTLLQRKGRILDLFTNLRAQLADDPGAVTLLDELNATSTQLSNLTTNPPLDLSTEAYQAQRQFLEEQLTTFEDQLSRRSSAFADITASPTVEDIQATLPRGTVLVEFIRYRPFNPAALASERFDSSRYAAYILAADGTIQGLDLGPADAVDAAVRTFSTSLASPDTALFQVKEDARVLDDLVMAPVRAALGNTTTVFLSPDDALSLIPFEALVDESNRYLVETYQFRYLTSGRDLMRIADTAPSNNPAVLMGNPTYGRPGSLVAQAETRTIDFKSRIFPALPGTQAEVDLIAPLLPSPWVYTQTNATEAVIKQQTKPSILHIATHGFFEPNEDTFNPLLQSGLVLAGAADGQSGLDQDGILTALEVTELDLRGTQLVVLSACQTGLGELSSGEGLYGLRRALMLAGAQSQVISLWKVSDDATQKLMVAYYQSLLSGTPRDASLRDTQLAFLQEPDYAHPYYWAAFIGSGDWRPLE